MILTYSFRKFPELILNGTKIHTIRKDETNRWKPGRSIQHWMHNPRNVSKNPFPFKESECVSIQNFRIDAQEIFIDGKYKTDIVNAIAFNDGFDSVEDFWFYFNQDFKGVIIHWTNFKY